MSDLAEQVAALKTEIAAIKEKLEAERLQRHDRWDTLAGHIGTLEAKTEDLEALGQKTQSEITGMTKALTEIDQFLRGALGTAGMAERVAELEKFKQETKVQQATVDLSTLQAQVADLIRLKWLIFGGSATASAFISVIITLIMQGG